MDYKIHLNYISNTLLEQGGRGAGCLTEPEEFKKRINEMSNKQIREITESLDYLLDRTRKWWKEQQVEGN